MTVLGQTNKMLNYELKTVQYAQTLRVQYSCFLDGLYLRAWNNICEIQFSDSAQVRSIALLLATTSACLLVPPCP